jgi:hypothetical protein
MERLRKTTKYSVVIADVQTEIQKEKIQNTVLKLYRYINLLDTSYLNEPAFDFNINCNKCVTRVYLKPYLREVSATIFSNFAP